MIYLNFFRYQGQIAVLAAQVLWSEDVEAALSGKSGGLQGVLTQVEGTLTVLADCVLHKQPPLRRRKLEALVSFCLILISFAF